ncbi:succinate dehydrogenase, subunit D [Osmia lignaria lignaria]|uniref:succinate dehydrogenase, subunit D n=1 Tax=Osmia lignaria lignaria TaxID=1437193 RepID=UPI001478D261|nr:succinate dehydrogenase [ubiquinone] cytochrome b small subunit, mitochondrial-like [Osmia lignaria]
MIVKKIIASNIFHKVRQLESLSKTNLLANSCKLPQFGRTSTTLANPKQCLHSNVMNNGTKFPVIGTVGLQLSRKASTINSDHVRLWVFEKLVSSALPVIIPAALIMENAALDGIMSVLIVMHTHWGLEAIITDYARPIIVGTVVPKVLHLSLFILSAVTLCGLLVLINDGPGVSRAIKNFWAIGKKPKESVASDE